MAYMLGIQYTLFTKGNIWGMDNIHITQWVGKGYEERIGGDTYWLRKRRVK